MGLLVVMGALSVVGGFVGFAQMWPGAGGYGYHWPFAAYIPSLGSLLAGLVAAVVSFGLARVVTQLETMREVTNTVEVILQRVETKLDVASRGAPQTGAGPTARAMTGVDASPAEETSHAVELLKSLGYHVMSDDAGRWVISAIGRGNWYCYSDEKLSAFAKAEEARLTRPQAD